MIEIGEVISIDTMDSSLKEKQALYLIIRVIMPRQSLPLWHESPPKFCWTPAIAIEVFSLARGLTD